MSAKILTALALVSSVTAGGLATWTVQNTQPFRLDQNTLVPIGAVLATISFVVLVTTRVWQHLDSQSELKQNVNTLMRIVVGEKDEKTGRREGGLITTVERIESKIDDLSPEKREESRER